MALHAYKITNFFKFGADTTLLNCFGQTPAQRALEYGNHPAVAMFIEENAKATAGMFKAKSTNAVPLAGKRTRDEDSEELNRPTKRLKTGNEQNPPPKASVEQEKEKTSEAQTGNRFNP